MNLQFDFNDIATIAMFDVMSANFDWLSTNNVEIVGRC